ncbi:unnamed protein product [Euphydryas editha]|uniref:TGF-beta propeptide domain-containing protein n=1 Tax=Euphydryas editha TaxID=104508 RepID=A0AAU9UZ39_EUPED|nr:unnamed protein product [Euphydryas editha]
MERVAAVNTSVGAEGWLELNVTAALAKWLGAPADNLGFFITLHPHSQPDTSHWTTRSCEIQTLYVSFKDLEWQTQNALKHTLTLLR